MAEWAKACSLKKILKRREAVEGKVFKLPGWNQLQPTAQVTDGSSTNAASHYSALLTCQRRRWCRHSGPALQRVCSGPLVSNTQWQMSIWAASLLRALFSLITRSLAAAMIWEPISSSKPVTSVPAPPFWIFTGGSGGPRAGQLHYTCTGGQRLEENYILSYKSFYFLHLSCIYFVPVVF